MTVHAHVKQWRTSTEVGASQNGVEVVLNVGQVNPQLGQRVASRNSGVRTPTRGRKDGVSCVSSRRQGVVWDIVHEGKNAVQIP